MMVPAVVMMIGADWLATMKMMKRLAQEPLPPGGSWGSQGGSQIHGHPTLAWYPRVASPFAHPRPLSWLAPCALVRFV